MKVRYFFLVLAVCLLALELLLRCFFPLHFADIPYSYRYDADLGYRWQDSLHLFRTTDYQQEIKTNRLGTVNFQEDFSGYKILVFALGDSFTSGVGVPADAGYPFQLDLWLNMKNNQYQRDYAVVNLGVPGYGVEQALLQLHRYREKLGAPQYILFLGCDNDYADDRTFLSGAIHKKLLAGNPRYNPYLLKVGQWLDYDSEIGKRLRLLQKSFKQMGFVGKPSAKPGEKPNFAALQEPVYDKLVRVSREMQATLILSWIPSHLDAKASEEYQWLKEYAGRHHVKFADWLPRARSVSDTMPELSMANPHSGAHYRTWVNGLIARAFAEQIKP